MDNLRLYWLGPPAVELNARPLRLEMRKTLALLAYLSLSPQPPTRETLATLFWPEFDQKHALSNLRRHLSSLANSLPPELLDVDRERIGLQRACVQTDIERFHTLLAQANRHGHSSGQICQECVSLLEQAVEVYRGDFFEGFNLKDCPEFDDWQFFHREGLRAEYAGSLEKLAGYYQQTGEWEKGIAHARAWLALDRLHEPAQQMLMRLYFLSGQKSAAVRQYQECERLLEQELGQPPAPETLNLYEEIRREAPPEARRVQPSLDKIKSPAGTPDIPLTKTKFFLPKVPRTILHRPRLVSQLNQCAEMPLTLISASAGFGKTTLLAEWAAQSKEVIAWISLDRSDNDQYRMVDYMVSAIQNVLQNSKVGTVALSLLHAPQPVQMAVILGSLINDLISIPNPLILVLDDYHNIDSPSAHDVINFLLDHRPDNLHLVISTRADPPLYLARLRINLQLGDIRTDDLRFTFDETQVFLTQVIGLPLSEQDMVFFENKVEGWIAGIQMAALVMQSNNPSQSSSDLHSFIRSFKGSQRFILDYLVEEVLNRQPEEIRGFLLRTSILEKLCFQLCDCLLAGDGSEEQQIDHPELVEKKSSQHILELLERSNLFLIPLDDERKWYRYHHLFADLLHARLQQHEPKLEAFLHKRAANWYAQNSYSMEAVKHALDSGDYSYAADLIEEYSLKLMWMNQIVTTFEWFKSLPAEMLESRPLLTIYQTYILSRRGEFERVETMLANAEDYLTKVPNSPKIDEYKTLIYGTRAFIANLRGDVDKAIQFSLGLPFVIENQHTATYFLTRTQLAVAYLDKGDLPSAERVLTEMLVWAQENQDVFYTILTYKELAEIVSLRGLLSQVEQIYRQMNDWIQRTVQEPALYNGLVRVLEARLLIEKNELETACLLLKEDIESMLSVWRTTSIYSGYMVLAYLFTALRDFQRARHEVEKAVNFVTSQSVYPRNRSTVLACQVNLWLAEGDLAEAEKWATSNFPQIPTDLSAVRELDHICLARVWIASQRWEEALSLLQRLSSTAEAGGRFGRVLMVNILQALALDGLGRFEEALDILEACLKFACPEGYKRVFLDEGIPMKTLLQEGKRRKWHDPELLEYVDQLLEAF